MNSHNMNYFYNVEYFSNLSVLLEQDRNRKRLKQDSLMAVRNREMEEFCFPEPAPIAMWSQAGLSGFQMLRMYTAYPGLLAGIGYAHDLNVSEAVKTGFSFDYVTGLPYIPSSSLKGTLRSYFPGDGKDMQTSMEYEEYIRCLLSEILAGRGAENEAAYIDIDSLKANIFEAGDVFLGAYPVNEEDISKPIPYPLLRDDYSDSCKQPLKSARPVRMMKVRAGVPFAFCFQLTDYCVEGRTVVTAAEKLRLFAMLLQELGVGAKVSLGYGRFTMEPPKNGVQERKPETCICATPECGNPVIRNKKTGKWYRYCYKCNAKYIAQSQPKENKNAETV